MNNEIAGPWWHVALGFIAGVTITVACFASLKYFGFIAIV